MLPKPTVWDPTSIALMTPLPRKKMYVYLTYHSLSYLFQATGYSVKMTVGTIIDVTQTNCLGSDVNCFDDSSSA